jgi:putative peptidoglycan lipid II flippase
MAERIARSAGVIGLATLASRVLGLLRDMVQAAFFATGPAADAFVVATRIPTLLRDLFAEGAMSAAFVPTFTRRLTSEGRPAAWRLGSQVINGLLVITGVLVLLGIAFADPLARLYAADYAETPGKLELTIRLTRINMPFLTMIAVAAALMGMLNALKQFAAPALSPALYNVVFIVCTAVFAPFFGSVGIEPVMALSLGMLLGGLAQVVAQWPAIRREGYQHSWTLDPRDPGLREVLFLMGPGSLGVAAAQINLLVNTVLATGEPGAVSALGYAFRLMYMPIGIFSVSVATATIPDLARHAAEGQLDRMRSTLSFALRLMLMLSVPATVGLVVLSYPIVEWIYERGQFGAGSTALVADALRYYAPGIIGYSVVKIVSPGFYSLRDARTPMVVSMITIALNLGLNVWLNRLMGFSGLALGTAIAANVNAGLLIWLLARRIDGVDGRRVFVSLAKIAAASALMGVVVVFVEAWLRTVLDTAPGSGPFHVALVRGARVSAAIGAGLGMLAVAAWVLHIDEFRQAIGRLLARLRR